MNKDDIKYPHVEVQLVGTDGNVFALFGRVKDAMLKAGISREEVEAYRVEAMQRSYDHFLSVTRKTVRIR